MRQSIGQKLKGRVIIFLARRLPPCNVLLPLFSDERERPLTLREKITGKLHLFTCQACRRYVAQIEKMSRMVKPPEVTETAAAIPPSDKLSADASSRIRAALEEAAQRKKQKKQ